MTTRKEKTKKLILIVFLMLICSVLIYSYTKTPSKQNNISSTTTPINPIGKTYGVTAINTTLLVNDTKYETQIAKTISVYDFMTQLQNEGKITFQDTTYTGMGKFIEEINGVKNGNKNWIYYVNGEKAEIGISNYEINPGDVVSWKYESGTN